MFPAQLEAGFLQAKRSQSIVTQHLHGSATELLKVRDKNQPRIVRQAEQHYSVQRAPGTANRAML